MANLSNSKTMRFRAGKASGITGKIDRKAGIIYGVAVNTEGEALGHGVHLEREFIEAVVEQGNAMPNGLKVRFGHPSMSSSAIGTFLGREKNFRVEDNERGEAVARADMYVSESAKSAPNGDLFNYTFDLAEHDADMFGTSIVFNAKAEYRRDESGEKVYRYTTDEDGNESYNRKFSQAKGKTFVELGKLRADDVVDSPAANPDGLFSQFSDSPAKAMTEFLDDNPQIWDMFRDVDEDELANIFSAFRERYSANRAGLQSHAANTKKEERDNIMPKEQENTEVVDLRALEAAKAEGKKTAADQLKVLLSEFSQDVAMDAFEKGLTVDQVKASLYDEQKTQIEALSAEVAELKAKKPIAEGEPTPVAYQEEEAPVSTNIHQQFDDCVQSFRDKGLSQVDAMSKATAMLPEIANKIATQA